MAQAWTSIEAAVHKVHPAAPLLGHLYEELRGKRMVGHCLLHLPLGSFLCPSSLLETAFSINTSMQWSGFAQDDAAIIIVRYVNCIIWAYAFS